MPKACPENREKNLECKTALRGEELITEILSCWHLIVPITSMSGGRVFCTAEQPGTQPASTVSMPSAGLRQTSSVAQSAWVLSKRPAHAWET